MPENRRFICPDNPVNRKQHQDLQSFKDGGWEVINAEQAPEDPNILVVTLSPGPAGSGTPSVGTASAMPRSPVTKPPKSKVGRKTVVLDARPDPIDFRDKLYVPTLGEVPVEWPLEQYLKLWGKKPLILDQGQEGACTGFGLAAVANFLLRRRKIRPDKTPVSPRMFYEIARRYDEWEGEDYSGSSARGAMKGWQKHGVCADKSWRYEAADAEGTLTPDRARDALLRPLGAYFRVNHRELVAMHSALAEVGILYATASVHDGWGRVGRDGIIEQENTITGGHAFAIVGYDRDGFWIQNSWGADWGRGGFGHISYDDWLTNGTDIWVARLGAPVISKSAVRTEEAFGAASLSTEIRRAQLQHHTISLGNDGRLREKGEVGNNRADVERIFAAGGDFETLTKTWKRKRILLYAHGGLVSERDALQRVSEYLPPLLENEVYPVAFIWKTDFWSTLGNILKDAVAKRRPEGIFDSAKDFMLDRLDDTLELLVQIPGRMVWSEMKENAVLSTERADGGGRLVLELLLALLKRDPKIEIHFAGHSAGSIMLGPLFRRFTQAGQMVESLNLWAPACTMSFFRENYVPALESGQVARFGLYTLKDPAERDDDCARIYNKSLLYLVAHACEKKLRVFLGDGTPLLGMEKFILKESTLFGVDAETVRKQNPHAVKLPLGKDAWWIRSPNNLQPGDTFASTSRHHGDFDDDDATVKSTFARILGTTKTPPVGAENQLDFRPTQSGLRACREKLAKAMDQNTR